MYVPCSTSKRFLSVVDSKASNTAAPTSKYVNVHTINDRVRTFCFFITAKSPRRPGLEAHPQLLLYCDIQSKNILTMYSTTLFTAFPANLQISNLSLLNSECISFFGTFLATVVYNKQPLARKDDMPVVKLDYLTQL